MKIVYLTKVIFSKKKYSFIILGRAYVVENGLRNNINDLVVNVFQIVNVVKYPQVVFECIAIWYRMFLWFQ